MRSDPTTTNRLKGVALLRSHRRNRGDQPPPAAGAALPPGVTREQYLSACAQVHTLDRAVRSLGLTPQPQTVVLAQKLSALSAQVGGAR